MEEKVSSCGNRFTHQNLFIDINYSPFQNDTRDLDLNIFLLLKITGCILGSSPVPWVTLQTNTQTEL